VATPEPRSQVAQTLAHEPHVLMQACHAFRLSGQISSALAALQATVGGTALENSCGGCVGSGNR